MEKIRFEHVTKKFGKVVANRDVTFGIEKGEVLSILGENGSGKTTLMNVLAGIYQQDEGKVFIDGEEVTIKSPKDAFAHKIGMVHQHFKLVEVFTATENIVLGLTKKDYKKLSQNLIEKRDKLLSELSKAEPGSIAQSGYSEEVRRLDKEIKQAGRYNLKNSATRIKTMCAKYGFNLDPNKHVFEMSVSEKQTLEIVKVLYRGVDTLILDEPTAVLTPQEIKHLFDVIRNMKKDGKTVVIITHKLNEVMEISDRIAVLRKGEYITTVKKEETTEAKLAELMVGRKIDLDIKRTEIPNSGVRLEIRGLSANDRDGNEILRNISFDVNGSEILGIAGISGSGQRELLETIAGLNRETCGDIIFYNPKENKPVTFFHKDLKQIKELAAQGKFHYEDGSQVSLFRKTNKEIEQLVNDGKILFYENEVIDLKGKKPIEIRDLGIKLSFVPEDRLGMGLVGNMDLVDNMMLRSYRKGKGIFLHKEKPTELAREIVDKLEVQTPSLHTQVRKLSGGNIQKVLVGREISSRPKVLMAAYPVRGLDINSSYLIYRLLDEQKQKGTAVIFVGEDLDVLMALSDRIMVLANGKISGIVDPRKVSKEEIGILMTKTFKEEE